MDELMTMMNQLAAGETAQIVKDIQHMMQTNVIPVIVVLVAGLLVCFFGLKLIRLFAALTGICIGAVAGIAVSWTVGLQGVAFLAAAIAGAVVFGVLGAALRRVGGFLFIWALTTGVLESVFVPGSLLFHLIFLGIGLILAIIAAILMEPIVIVISGLGGGIFAGMAAVALAGMEDMVLLTYGAGIILAVLGMSVQFMAKSREVGRKEKRYSEAVKEEKSMETEVEKARMLLDDELEGGKEETAQDEKEEQEGGSEKDKTEVEKSAK